MSDLIDKLGQVITEVDKSGQIQSAISGMRQRMAEADRRRKINYVKQQLQDLRTQEAQAINALSAQVLALHEAGSLSQPELVSLCKGVDEIRAQIKVQEAELELIQPSPAQPAPPQRLQPDPKALCPKCGVTVIKGAVFCQTCGAPLAAEEPLPPVLFCVHCGAQLREGARFCPKCGQTIP